MDRWRRAGCSPRRAPPDDLAEYRRVARLTGGRQFAPAWKKCLPPVQRPHLTPMALGMPGKCRKSRAFTSASGGDATNTIGHFIQLIHCFNPRLRREATCVTRGDTGYIIAFQSTPLGGRRRIIHIVVIRHKVFQSMPPVEATQRINTLPPISKCFNPRLRGEATRHALDNERNSHLVSIHASWGEATRIGEKIRDHYTVSIHASGGEATASSQGSFSTSLFQSTPPGGRRLRVPGRVPGLYCFNPRLRGGGDYEFPAAFLDYTVSIHASGGEATC